MARFLCFFTAFLALVKCSVVQQGGHIVLVDNRQGAYLRSHHDQVPVSFSTSNAVLAVLLGLQPSSLIDETTSAQVDSILKPDVFHRPRAVLDVRVASGSPGVLGTAAGAASVVGDLPHQSRPLTEPPGTSSNVEVSISPDLKLHQLDCNHLVCDAACVQEFLQDTGLDAEGAAEQRLGHELFCLANSLPTIEATGLEARSTNQRHLITSNLHCLDEFVKQYGRESEQYSTAALILAQALQKVVMTAQESLGGEMVAQITAMAGALNQGTGEGRPKRQLLEASGVSERDASEWQDTALAASLMFMLSVILFIALLCMCSMDIKQDTLLYGKGKME